MDEREQQEIFRAMEQMFAQIKFDAPTPELRAMYDEWLRQLPMPALMAIQTHPSLLHWTYRDDWGRETLLMREVEEWDA